MELVDRLCECIPLETPCRNANKEQCEQLCLQERKMLSSEDGGYKFLDYYMWNSNKKTILGIGFNPALSDLGQIDDTNKKIIDALKQKNDGYGQYILTNLYSRVASTEVEFGMIDAKSQNFNSKILPVLLDLILENKDIDVLIFWGRGVEINSELYDRLLQLCRAKRLYITVKQGDSQKPHWHPSRVSIEIEKASTNRFKFKII